MDKKKNKIILGCVILITIIIVIFIASSKNNEITGNEKVVASNYTVQNLAEFNNQLDSVTSLYLTGYISREDYLNHLSEFKKELITIKAEYDNLPETNLNEVTENSEKGNQALERIIELNTDNLGYKQAHSGDKKLILKHQLVYKDEIIKYTKIFEESNKIAQKELGKARTEEIRNGNL